MRLPRRIAVRTGLHCLQSGKVSFGLSREMDFNPQRTSYEDSSVKGRVTEMSGCDRVEKAEHRAKKNAAHN